jgi:hypothetical protein
MLLSLLLSELLQFFKPFGLRTLLLIDILEVPVLVGLLDVILVSERVDEVVLVPNLSFLFVTHLVIVTEMKRVHLLRPTELELVLRHLLLLSLLSLLLQLLMLVLELLSIHLLEDTLLVEQGQLLLLVLLQHLLLRHANQPSHLLPLYLSQTLKGMLLETSVVLIQQLLVLRWIVVVIV